MKFKNIVISTLISQFLIISTSYAKEITYLGGGTLRLQGTDNLNKVLNNNDFKGFSSDFSFWSTGSRDISGKVVTGSETNVSFENKSISSADGTYNTFLATNFNAILDVGYVLYSNEDFAVYPLVGLGVGKVSFDIFKNQKNLNLTDILKVPERGTSFSNTSIVMDLGLATDYVFRFGNPDNKVGIPLGLKAGYVFSLYSFGFNVKGEPIKDFPELNNNAFYVKMFTGYEEGIIPALLALFK